VQHERHECSNTETMAHMNNTRCHKRECASARGRRGQAGHAAPDITKVMACTCANETSPAYLYQLPHCHHLAALIAHKHELLINVDRSSVGCAHTHAHRVAEHRSRELFDALGHGG